MNEENTMGKTVLGEDVGVPPDGWATPYDYVDSADVPLTVGAFVSIVGAVVEESDPPETWIGRVTAIVEPDGDSDDEGRSIVRGPLLDVRFGDGMEDRFTGRWLGGWFDDDGPFRFEDVLIVPRPAWWHFTLPEAYDVLRELMLATGHRFRLDILVELLKGPESPKTLADRHESTIGALAYHFRCLHDDELIEVERTERRRGAVQTYYRLSASGRRLIAGAGGEAG